MNKIPFKDLPDTTTPVDADNLNLLQDNVSNDINDINSRVNKKIEVTILKIYYTQLLVTIIGILSGNHQ